MKELKTKSLGIFASRVEATHYLELLGAEKIGYVNRKDYGDAIYLLDDIKIREYMDGLCVLNIPNEFSANRKNRLL